MMHWLSQYWVSRSIDRGAKPSGLWRYTFGRLTSHKRFATQMNQLDAQLKRQAVSQQRAIARENLPVGRYTNQTIPADTSHREKQALRGGLLGGDSGWLRPALTVGSLAAVLGLAVIGGVIWFNTPTHSPQELRAMATESFDRVWQPLSKQAETTGRALREQTVHVTRLPQRLPEVDKVVNGLGEAIQSPIQEEVRRFTDDLKRPWTYLAGQLPKMPGGTGGVGGTGGPETQVDEPMQS